MYTLNLTIVTQILRLLLLILFWISGATREIIRVRFLIDFLSRVTPFTLAAICMSPNALTLHLLHPN